METNNNGLRHTVEVLEAIYTVSSFPQGAPELPVSLKESGKSRADLWALAGIVAVEFGIETNNLVCEDPESIHDQCHHLQGEAGCEVNLVKPIPFRTGRTDCIPTNPDRPYITSKQEVHPNAVGDGSETLKFFQDQFGFNGQETVAILGSHTFGRMHFETSLFRYTWTSKGTRMFNNDYYKMITDDRRWYFSRDDFTCTRVGDALNNQPARRWLARYRRDTYDGGAPHWISENYVCPNCNGNGKDTKDNTAKDCCKNVPEGQFCNADEKNMTQKTPSELNYFSTSCEYFRIIPSLDEMGLNCEMGLYFDFKNSGNGFPRGCPGLETFDGKQTDNSRTWSEIDGVKAAAGCGLASYKLPATDQSTSWYMREYAVNQERFLTDFVAVFDKMLSNGYTDLPLGEDQWTGIQCTSQVAFNSTYDKWVRPTGSNEGTFSQCWEEGEVDQSSEFRSEFLIISKLSGKVAELNKETGELEMKERNDTNLWQRWQPRVVDSSSVSGQLVNVGSGRVLELLGLSDFQPGIFDTEGYTSIKASQGVSTGSGAAVWDCQGDKVSIKTEAEEDNQKFKFEQMKFYAK